MINQQTEYFRNCVIRKLNEWTDLVPCEYMSAADKQDLRSDTITFVDDLIAASYQAGTKDTEVLRKVIREELDKMSEDK